MAAGHAAFPAAQPSAVIDVEHHDSRHRASGLGPEPDCCEWSFEALEAEWRRGNGQGLPPLPPGRDSLRHYQARAAALNKFGINLSSADPFKAKGAGRSDEWFAWVTWSPLDFCNYAGTLYSFCVIFLLFFANAYFTCPILRRGTEETCDGPILKGYFFLAEIITNFLLFHYYGRYNRFSKLFPVTLKEDGTVTKFCVTCREVVPRRSHHCPLCKVCVFHKDHHCFLVGGCVGIANQRYFLGFLLWAVVGAGYGTSWVFAYLLQASALPAFLPWGWLDYIGPLALKKWLIWQHIPLVDLALVLLSSAGIASTFGALAFLLSQLFLVSRGRTMWDLNKQRTAAAPGAQRASDRLSVNQRFKMIMGPWWLVQFFVPIPLLKNRIDTASLYEIYQTASKDL